MKFIRTFFVAALAVFIFTNSTCAKKVKLEKDVDGASVTVVALPHLAGAFDYTEGASFNIDSLIDQFDLSSSKLVSIQPHSATITIIDTTGTPVNFDIMDKANVELSTPTIANTRVAFKDPMPHIGLTSITPDVDASVDVLAFAQANNITYHFSGVLNTALTHAVQVKITIKWHIVGNL